MQLRCLSALACFWLVAGSVTGSEPPETSRLTVTVEGFETSSGTVRLHLYDSEEAYRQRNAWKTASLKVKDGRCEWVVEELTPGQYAVMVHHDLNDNGKLDHSFLGPPTEPLAFSNDARGIIGSPSFTAARFEVAEGENSQLVNMRSVTGTWSLGLGFITGTRPYRGIDGRFFAFPIIGYEGERLSWRGPRLSYRVHTVGSVDLRAVAEVRFDGYDHDDTSRLDGMQDRDFSLDAGGGLSYRFLPRWRLEGELLRDVLGKHKGQEFRSSLKRSFSHGRWTVTPSVGLKILSNRTADYYYGVRRSEARPGRSAYNVGSALNWEAGIGMNYRSAGHWMVVGNVGVEVLDPDINDSPIVARDTLFSLFLGVVYVF